MPLRIVFAVLFAVSALGIARPPLAAASDFTPDQKKEIEGIIGDYLKNHPDVLIDAIQAADDKLKADAKDKVSQALAANRQQVYDDPQSPVAGNPNGNVTLVEFFDYRCPYCKQVEPSLEKLIGEDHQLKFVFKEFPVLGPDSEVAARVALAAKKQGKYDAFHRAMMDTAGHIDETVIYKVAASVGLDIDRLKQDIELARYREGAEGQSRSRQDARPRRHAVLYRRHHDRARRDQRRGFEAARGGRAEEIEGAVRRGAACRPRRGCATARGSRCGRNRHGRGAASRGRRRSARRLCAIYGGR